VDDDITSARMAIGFEERPLLGLMDGHLGELQQSESPWVRQTGVGALGPLGLLFDHHPIRAPEGHVLTGFSIETYVGDLGGVEVRSMRTVWWSRPWPVHLGAGGEFHWTTRSVPLLDGSIFLLKQMPLCVPDGCALTSLRVSVMDTDGSLEVCLRASAIWVVGDRGPGGPGSVP
jgi:hypothetical protein